MDECDAQILGILVKDSRTSLTEISEKANLSRFAVRDRIRRLFADGIILGPTIVVDLSMVGISRTVFLELKTNPHEPWLAKMLEELSSCDLLDGIAGEFSLFGRLRLIDDEDFRRVLKRIDHTMARSYFKKYRAVNAIRIYKESGVAFQARAQEASEVDSVDLKLLQILLNQTEKANSPLPPSTIALSRRLRDFGIELSQPAVFNRLSRLEKRGMILRHTVRVDYSKLGLRAKFIARIKVNPNVYDHVAQEFLASMPEIIDLYRTGEEYGLLATVRVKDVSEYNSFLLRLYDSKDTIDTHTTLVLEKRKDSALSLRKD